MRLMFDLDGTLTDSRLGITRCIQHALATMGAMVPPGEALTKYVGPPLAASFATLLDTSNVSRIEAAIAAYRRRFEQAGIFENQLFPGIAEMLKAFDEAGHELCVVTVKPRRYAIRVLEHFQIAGLFRQVYGPDLRDRDCIKEALIRKACARNSESAGGRIVIGDRAEDVRGAKTNGAGAVGVTWGYGEREELEAAEPDRIVESTVELIEYISRHP
jgi:phosphoglycolate phosphatase